MTSKNPDEYISQQKDLVKIGCRKIFNKIEAISYLNYAAFTPPSLLTRKVMDDWFDDYASNGAAAYINWANQRERLREKLAKLINCKAENIGFGDSTSGLVSDVTLMLDWKDGDRVLVFDGDFHQSYTSQKCCKNVQPRGYYAWLGWFRRWHWSRFTKN